MSNYIYLYTDNYTNEPSSEVYNKGLDVIHAVLEDIQNNELELSELNFNLESYLSILERVHEINICTVSINYTIYKLPVI